MRIEYCIKYNLYDGKGEQIYSKYDNLDKALMELPFVVEHLANGRIEQAWIEMRSVSQWQKVKID